MANQFSVDVPNPLQALMSFDQSYDTTRARTRKDQAQSTLQRLMQGGTPDLERASMAMLAAGDTESGLALAKLADARANNAFDRTYKTQSLELQRQAFNRREEPDDVRKLRIVGIDPKSPAGVKALFPRTDTPLSPTDKKAVMAAEDDVPRLEATIKNVKRAIELNDTVPSGFGASARGTLAAKLPDWMVPDFVATPQQGSATAEWDQIMGQQAIQMMGDTLKGASTDFEMRKFLGIAADTSQPPDVRKRAMERFTDLGVAELDLRKRRATELRSGEYFKPQTPTPAPARGGVGLQMRPQGSLPAGVAPAAAIAEAKAAIASGKNPAAIKSRLQSWGIDTSGL